MQVGKIPGKSVNIEGNCFAKTSLVNICRKLFGSKSTFIVKPLELCCSVLPVQFNTNLCNKQQSQIMGKRVLVQSPSILCRTRNSINDAKDEHIPKVNVLEQSSQSMSISTFDDLSTH
jgi:hypothetical protein